MVSEEEIDAYARMLVFVPYRGFYFLNMENNYKELNNLLFSSPIGAFIFLIELSVSKRNSNFYFEFSSPIGAFIFLIDPYSEMKKELLFSSPIGAFIFLIDPYSGMKKELLFSSPIGAFIFLIPQKAQINTRYTVFVPYRGFYFLNERSTNQ